MAVIPYPPLLVDWRDSKLSPCLRLVAFVILLVASLSFGAADVKKEPLWSLTPVVRPQVPAGVTKSANPIDAFIRAVHKTKGLRPAGPADKLTLLRRVHFDLIGLPPTPAEQDAFLKDESPDAYDKVVDRLLANEQHGVRYARHWLDVLRYADADERMYAAPGIHLWAIGLSTPSIAICHTTNSSGRN